MNNDDNIMRRVCSHAFAVCRRSDRLARREMIKGRSKTNIDLQSDVTGRAGCSSVGVTLSGYKVSGVESRHAIKQMVDSRKGATCETSVAGLALPRPASLCKH
jgi:hypothetical protein